MDPRVLIMLCLVLAGCASPADDVTVEPREAHPDTMRIEGVVQTTAFAPISGATATIGNHTATTDGEGRFAFELPPAFYILNVTAPGFLPFVAALTPEPGIVPVDVQLVPVPDTPYQETIRFRGHIQCAAEYVIISGGCDAVLTSGQTLGMDPIFSSNSSLEIDIGAGWKTLVTDVVFDGDAEPGMDGLRVVVQGVRDASEVLTYEQYARFHGSESFTFRLAPGESYEEGERDVPLNQTAFRFEVYPHSHGWHATCETVCLLGAGAGVDVEFELLVTAFYVEPAPTGWTLL